MKRWMIPGLVAAVLAINVVLVRGQDAKTDAKPAEAAANQASGTSGASGLTSQNDKISYAIGASIANDLRMRGATDLNPDAVSQGFKDIMLGKSQLTQGEMQNLLKGFSQDLQAKAAEAMKHVAEKNKTEGEAFLAKNKTEPGVMTTPSGLQYKVIKEGTGRSPASTDTVAVKYKGSFLDGTVFDASDMHAGEPIAHFEVDRVIPGWTEALQLMKVGSKYQLFIPAELAYGADGRGGIPPAAVLIFEVELVSIDTPAAAH